MTHSLPICLALLLAMPPTAVARPPDRPAPSASAVQTQPQVTRRQRQLERPDHVPVDVSGVVEDLATALRKTPQEVPKVVWMPPSVAAGACVVPPSQLPTGSTRAERPAPACAAKQVTTGLVDAVQGAMASARPREGPR